MFVLPLAGITIGVASPLVFCFRLSISVFVSRLRSSLLDVGFRITFSVFCCLSRLSLLACGFHSSITVYASRFPLSLFAFYLCSSLVSDSWRSALHLDDCIVGFSIPLAS